MSLGAKYEFLFTDIYCSIKRLDIYTTQKNAHNHINLHAEKPKHRVLFYQGTPYHHILVLSGPA